MPKDAMVFLSVDGPTGKQYILSNKLQEHDHKWITCSQFIAEISRKPMKYPENFHASTSGLNSLVNFEVPNEECVKWQSFCVNFEGSKQCTTTGSLGLHDPVFDDNTISKYADTMVNAMKQTPLTDNVYDALEKHGQCALTGPSGPTQGVANPSNGEWKLKPEIKKVNDVDI